MRTLIIGLALAAVVGPATWALQGRGGADDTSVATKSAPMDAILKNGSMAAAEDHTKESEQDEDVAEDAVTWDLTVTRNDRVEHWIEYLTTTKRDRMHLWLERMGRYGPMIQAKLDARGMPRDLIYFALIESGFSPKAYSSAHASGIWQFIAETGRRYGLEISSYVDERRDPVKATDAALDYLEDLYDQFGSWYLAAAAYNSGENRIERILRQRAGGARGDDALYWKISPYIPRETRDYVPLMLAAGHIAKEPERYGFHDLDYQEPLAFETVEVPGGTPLDLVGRAAGVDAARVENLNPHLLAGMTPPGERGGVRIPEGHRQQFARNFSRMAEEERRSRVVHTVRRGETLSHIAKRYGTSVGRLRAANAGVHPRRLRVGQRVQVPTDGSVGAQSERRWRVHRVRRGDTLWDIARRYRVTVHQLRAWNGMRGSSRILPGQRIRIGA